MKKIFFNLIILMSFTLLCGCTTYNGYPCWISYKHKMEEQYDNAQPNWTDDTNELEKSYQTIKLLKEQRNRIGTTNQLSLKSNL